jgi:hypothetical protein
MGSLGKLEVKSTFGGPSRRWEVIFKEDLKEISWEGNLLRIVTTG